MPHTPVRRIFPHPLPIIHIPVPPHSPAPAWVVGIISTLHAVREGLQDRDHKIFHRFKIHSLDELHFHQGCAFASERLMDEAGWQEVMKNLQISQTSVDTIK